MENLYFEDYEDFAYEIADTLEEVRHEDCLNDVSIIAMYDDAKEIIHNLIFLGFELNNVNLQNPELGYDDVPYIISLTNLNNERNEIWCEPFLRSNGYIDEEANVTYVLDNCPSECLRTIHSEDIYEVNIGDLCCEEDCECCGACFDTVAHTNNKEKLATKETASYKVNGKEVSREEFEKFKKKIDDEYLNTVRDMLLKHCSIMDEINEMSRLIRW